MSTSSFHPISAFVSTALRRKSNAPRQLARTALLLLQPGLGIKRWALLAGLGLALLALGVGFAASASISAALVDMGRALTLANVLPSIWRGVIFVGLGALVLVFSLLRLLRTIQFGSSYSPGDVSVLEGLSAHRARRRGPRLVAIGGGTGLSTLLRGLKRYTEEITAIVTVTDDGGSSGRLRSQFGISPPGDARQCLIALSDAEPLMEQLFSYRFESGEGLQGHSMGNLLLTALTEGTGNFHEALQTAARLLAVKGQVVPSSISPNLVLNAETVSGRVLAGETVVGQAAERIGRVWVEPEACEVNPAAVEAIQMADALIIGPGSLYTSVLPNFLVPGLAEAVAASKAPKLFVCNVATQQGETDGLSASSHLEVFERHAGVKITHFLVNSHPGVVPLESGQEPVLAERPQGFNGHYVAMDLLSPTMSTRHDPEKLANVVLGIVRRTRARTPFRRGRSG